MAPTIPTPEAIPNWQSPFAQFLDSETPSGNAGSIPAIQEAPRQFGTPGTDQLHWQGQQGYPDTCAIRCQEFILEQFSGQQIPEEALVRQAMEQGWYQPGNGTQFQDVGNLLELNGVPVTRFHDATVFNLSNELAQGHKVIVGVDSGELWHRNTVLDGLADKLGFSGADHAIVVSGIDTSDPNHIQVIVSDPGTGEATATYPLEQFVDAWQDSGFYMVATQNPAPSHVPGMTNFDYAQGHIDQVWGLDYHEFLGLADQPELWSSYLDQPLGAANTVGHEFNTRHDIESAVTPHSFLAGTFSVPTTLPGLIDSFLHTCHLDDADGGSPTDSVNSLDSSSHDAVDSNAVPDCDSNST